MLILIITTITLYLKSRVIFVCTAKELCWGDFKSNYIKLNPINPMVLKKGRTSGSNVENKQTPSPYIVESRIEPRPYWWVTTVKYSHIFKRHTTLQT